MSKRTVLIADFFGTVKTRGIAAYVRDLEAILEPVARVRTVRAPAWVRRLPDPAQNVLLVVHEQLIVPIVALLTWPDRIVFPYNSCSLALSLSRRTFCVVHDLIPYRKATRRSSLSFRYVATTVAFHARLGRTFVVVSPATARLLKSLPKFRKCRIIYIPNCFSASRPVAASPLRPAGSRVTLVSGIGPNKDYRRALALMRATLGEPALARLSFEIVGFGDAGQVARERTSAFVRADGALPRLTIHDLLARPELDALLASSAVVWAHSRAEGFGRVVVEGRLAGRPVLMSRLPVFRTLRDDWTFAYDNDDTADFLHQLKAALLAADVAGPYTRLHTLQDQARAGANEMLIP